MFIIAFLNLLENAIKYTFEGQIDIILSYDHDESQLTTEINDTGIGMNSEQLSSVGTLFKIKKTRCTMNPQGLGIGLFLAKALSHNLDGELKISSIVNKGTIAAFKISGNSSRGRRLEKRSSSVFSVIPNERIEPMCDEIEVLLVDDEPLNLMILSAYLKSVNIKADKAENGQIALNLIQNKAKHNPGSHYNVIFMDINMPVMDGITATERIKEMIKNGIIASSPVIAVTAAANLDDPVVYNQYLTKGFALLCIIGFNYSL